MLQMAVQVLLPSNALTSIENLARLCLIRAFLNSITSRAGVMRDQLHYKFRLIFSTNASPLTHRIHVQMVVAYLK